MENTVNHHFAQKEFDWDLKISKDEIPDPQCFHVNDIEGGQVIIQKVGITELDFPIDLAMRDGTRQLVHGKVSAYVSLDAIKSRGINMSRLCKSFYDNLQDREGVDLDDFFEIVEAYKRDLPSNNAYLKVRFELPLKQKALREDHFGWVYYPTTLEIRNENGVVKSYLTIKYLYASACPCSAALAEYSRTALDTPAISHSQRSIADITVEFDNNNTDRLWIETLIEHCRVAMPSELLGGRVSRVMELSFSQLVAAKNVTSFVEDALRRFYAVLNKDSRVLDFVVSVSHQESLNVNLANGVIYKGIPGGLR